MSEKFEDKQGVEVVVDNLGWECTATLQPVDAGPQQSKRTKPKVEQAEVPNKEGQDQLHWSHSYQRWDKARPQKDQSNNEHAITNK